MVPFILKNTQKKPSGRSFLALRKVSSDMQWVQKGTPVEFHINSLISFLVLFIKSATD